MNEKTDDYYATHDEWGRPTTLEEYKKTNCHNYCDMAQKCNIKGKDGRDPDACPHYEFILHLMY